MFLVISDLDSDAVTLVHSTLVGIYGFQRALLFLDVFVLVSLWNIVVDITKITNMGPWEFRNTQLIYQLHNRMMNKL